MSSLELVGQTFGDFEIIAELGRGAMGVVYQARQLSLNRVVALKVLPPEFTYDKQYIDRFKREAQSAAGLEHPHIVPIYEVGEMQVSSWHLHYIVMRYISGETLRHVMQREGAMSVARIVALMTPVAAALDYAHTHQVIHRDIKPSNIMVARDGTVYLADFGLARVLGSGSTMTATGMVMGTPDYMSPEQAQGAPHVGPPTDIYALGIVIYQMLTGYLPFEADSTMAMVLARLTHPPRPPSDFRKDLPRTVEDVIMQALARAPDHRIESATKMVQALEQAAISGHVAEPTIVVSEPTIVVPHQLPRDSDPVPPIMPEPGGLPPTRSTPPGRIPPPGDLPPGSQQKRAPAGSPFGKVFLLGGGCITLVLILLAGGILASSFAWGVPFSMSSEITSQDEPTEEPEDEPTEEPEDEPTEEPEDEPTEEPEDEPTEEPEDEPTEEPEDEPTGLAEVEIEDLEAYSYPNGLFSIDVPSNWSSSDQSDETLKRVIFTDPYNNAAIAVVIIPTDGDVDEEDLEDLLIDDVETAFDEQDNFELGETEPQNDGSIRLIFTYETTTEGVTATELGNTFAQLDGDYVTLLYVIVPQDQFEDLQSDITEVINSLEVDGSVAFDGEEVPANMGSELQTYTHPSGLFSLDVPADWTIEDASQTGQVSINFTAPDELSAVSVNLFTQATALAEADFSTMLNTFAQELAAGASDLQVNDQVVPQSDGSFLLTFSYTDATGSALLINSFVQQNDDKLTLLAIIEDHPSQTDERDALLNSIINSYQVYTWVTIP